MNIIVCVKQVPGTTEVKMNDETNTIIREGVESVLNPFDTYAIEEALRIREKLGGKVTVLSMGLPSVADMLKETVALGADDTVLLSDRTFAGSDTLATAYALSLAIRKIGSSRAKPGRETGCAAHNLRAANRGNPRGRDPLPADD